MSLLSARLPLCDRWKIGVAVYRLFAHMLAAGEQEYGEADSDQFAMPLKYRTNFRRFRENGASETFHARAADRGHTRRGGRLGCDCVVGI